MFKAEILPVSIALVNSILGGIYVERFLERRWKKPLTFVVWILLYFISQIAVSRLTGNWYRVGGVLYVFFQIVVLLLIQLFLFYKDIFKHLFVSLSFIAGAEILKYIVSIVYSILADMGAAGFLKLFDWGMIHTNRETEVWNLVFEILILCAGMFVYAVLFAVYLNIVSKKFVNKNNFIQAYETVFLLLPNIAALSIAVTLKMMLLDVENGISVPVYEKIPAIKFWLPFICLLLLGMIVSSVIWFQKLVQLSEEEKKRVVLENQIKQIKREVGEIQEIYGDMRGLRHDMRNHLGNITAYVRKMVGKDCRELTDYIGKMEDTIHRLDFSCQTGNPITDIIIRQRSLQAAKQKIVLRADFTYPVKQQIDVYDIGIVLNNALENAIEACEKAEGKREIYLHSFLKGNLFFMEISNDFSGGISIDKETGLPVSHKRDKGAHGIGMSNILRCAKKYRGDMDISISEAEGRKKFHLTVMMNGSISLPE